MISLGPRRRGPGLIDSIGSWTGFSVVLDEVVEMDVVDRDLDEGGFDLEEGQGRRGGLIGI